MPLIAGKILIGFLVGTLIGLTGLGGGVLLLPLLIFGLHACFTSYTFTNNGVIGASEAFDASHWPTGNYFAATPSALFVNFAARNYRLASGTAMRSAPTTDGRDIGADVDAIQAAIEGVN